MTNSEKTPDDFKSSITINDHLVTMLIPQESYIADLLVTCATERLPEELPKIIKKLTFWFNVLLESKDMDDADFRKEFLHIIDYLKSINAPAKRHNKKFEGGAQGQLQMFLYHREALLNKGKGVANG